MNIKKLPAHMQRVVEENDELQSKIAKLRSFVNGSVFRTITKNEQLLLRRQLHHMVEYGIILNERIDVCMESLSE
ncbi:MAG: hypothetical protein J6562_08605 [Candidatus Schmidhempelia sp.]|nr:hypothetical protein [Candidatus Schmidhempelia sp.]